MRNASGHQCKKKMSGSEKKSEREHVRHFLHKKVSGSFTLWSCKTTAKKCTKKCAARAKLLFFLQIALRAVTIYRPETQTNKLKLTVANSSLLSDFCH